MRLFSLDTSFSFFNFSVVEDSKVVLLKYIDSSKKTLENLPKALSEEGIDLRDFDAFAVSVGVGYSTSLRIGVIFMKTSAYLLKKPLFTFENLELLARFVPSPYPKVPFLKVSRYVFYREVDKENISEIKIWEGEQVSGVGIGIEHLGRWEGVKNLILVPFFPFSAYGGLVAYERLAKGEQGEDPFKVEPIYLRPPT